MGNIKTNPKTDLFHYKYNSQTQHPCTNLTSGVGRCLDYFYCCEIIGL